MFYFLFLNALCAVAIIILLLPLCCVWCLYFGREESVVYGLSSIICDVTCNFVCILLCDHSVISAVTCNFVCVCIYIIVNVATC